MDAWEELAKEDYERDCSESKFDSLEQKEKREYVNKVKARAVYRLNILTDAYFGEKRFMPISNRLEELTDEQEKERLDNYQKCIKRMEKLEKQFYECAKKKKKLEQENSRGKIKGVLKADNEEDIKTLEHRQDRMKVKYGKLEEKALFLSMGIERERFVKLNDLEKELFGILLNKIRQADLWKMRHNKWEEFPLDMRNRIVELLDELCDEEQWRPVGTGMELNTGLIEYKLLYPREYRLIKVAEMLMGDVIPQEMKDNVLEKMDKSVFSAYKKLSKAISDILNDENENEAAIGDIERQMEEGIKRHLAKMNGK